jgi:hypothetical protein
MTEPPSSEHLPTREQLEREARRLARLRHLRLVPDPPREPAPDERVALLRGLDPDPKEAA